MASSQNSTADFAVSRNRLIILSFPALSCLFSPTFFFRNVAFIPRKKVYALRKSKVAMKQPALVSFHFQNSSIDQNNPSKSTFGENTDAFSPSIPDALATPPPPKKKKSYVLF